MGAPFFFFLGPERESVVLGKRVKIGGGRVIKKKKKRDRRENTT